MSRNNTKNCHTMYKVRLITPDGRRVTYNTRAASSEKAAQSKSSKGRVVSARKI